MLLNYGVGEDSWEFLRLQEDPISPSWRKSVLSVHWKDWCWSWNSNTSATRCEELTHWKRPWCWERLKVRGEGDNRGWDGWMASPTQQAWVWVNSGSCWWIGSLACCSPWGCKELDTTDWLNWTVFYLKWPSLVTWPLSLAVPPVHCGLWIILILSWVTANCHFKKGGISPSLSFPLLVGKGYHR